MSGWTDGRKIQRTEDKAEDETREFMQTSPSDTLSFLSGVYRKGTLDLKHSHTERDKYWNTTKTELLKKCKIMLPLFSRGTGY